MYADDTYKDLKTAEFTIQLAANHYMNFHNVHFVFPLKIKKKTNVANNILATQITVNNFFAHWIKEIDIKHLGDNIPVLLTTNTIEIYKYSDAMVKHILKDALEVIENDLLYSKKRVKLPANEDRRRDEHTAAAEDANNRTDDNLNQRIEKFQNQLKTVYYYRIPLIYICDLGLVNQPIKFNTKWRITFEQDMQRLFESKAQQAAAGLPDSIDAKIILDSTPYLPYYQFKLDKNFRNYLETTSASESKLRTGIQRTPYQKS